MGVELMLNAININLVAFWRFLTPDQSDWAGLCHFRFDCGRCRGSRWSGPDYLSLPQPPFGGRGELGFAQVVIGNWVDEAE